MLETNSTNKCPLPKCSHNTNRRDLDKPCSISYPMTQSKEWRNIESVAMNIVYQLDDDSGASVEFRQTNNDKRIDFVMQLICKTLRTELESLLQEIGYITAKPIGAGRPLTKENQAYNLALSTMREVISKRIQQYGGQ